MASLFGPTPQELIFANMKEDEKMRMLRNQQIGQEGGEFGVFAPLYRAGRRFGEMGSQAIVQGLFPQAADPALKQAQAVELVQQKYQGQNLGDPLVLKNIASDLFSAGAPDAGLRVLKTAQEITPKEKDRTAKDQAELAVFTINQIPEEQRTEEQNRILNAASMVLKTEGGGDQVQSSKILEDGTAVTVFKSGKREVLGPTGDVLTGDAAAKAVKDAAKFGVEIAGGKQAAATLQRLKLEAEYGGQIEGGREAGKQAIKISGEAFAALNNVRTNIGNLKSAQDALARGANTGAISARLPDITAASVELRNIQNRLGLDVVGSVTFGALSEGELGLALNTALPLNLPEADLKDYIIRKISAQEKLAKYLEEQAKFLSKPGNTLNKWLERDISKPEGSMAKGTTGASSSTQPRLRYNPATGRAE